MSNLTGLDLFVSLVDLIVIGVAVGILIYGLLAGLTKSDKPLPKGGIIIAAGTIIAVLAYVSDMAQQYLFPEAGVAAALSSSFFSTTWLNWALSRGAFVLLAIGLVVMVVARRKIDKDMVRKNALLENLRSSHDAADERFRYLFESTTDSVYCYSFSSPISIHDSIDEHIRRVLDAELCQANDVFIRDLKGDNVNAAIGQKFGDLLSAKDSESHAAFITAFIENGYWLEDYELNYKTPAGKDRALNVNMIGVVREGFLERIWGVESNILEARETKAELAHRQKYQKLVGDVSTRLITTPDDIADDAMQACLSDIANFFAADRILMWWLDEVDSVVVNVVYLWARSDTAPFGSSISMKTFPAFFKMLRNHEVIRIDSVAEMSAEYGADQKGLEDLKLKSLLVVPFLIADEVVGGMTVGHLENENHWTPQMVDDATVFSGIMANSLLRLRSRQALADALGDLQTATDRLEAENVYLREEVERKHGFDEIIGEHRTILKCLNQVEQVANTETPVLILGATGTGKELIARAIHDHSDRRDRALVKVNCAALPANLIESELFGHEKGAFTGAESRKRGRFDLAHGSTLFLDEIGEIPVELQAKLLRVLQEGQFERLGGTKTIEVDVRIVVATNRDLEEAVRQGEFRSDLYYRINTFPIELPALKERGSDVEILARHFVNLHAQRLGRNVREISSEMMRQLRSYHWPGNVRELDGIIQRALISNTGPIVELAEPLVRLEMDNGMPTIVGASLANLELVEHDHIVAVLEDSRWKISGEAGAASQLGIPPSTLRSKMKKLGIARPQ